MVRTIARATSSTYTKSRVAEPLPQTEKVLSPRN